MQNRGISSCDTAGEIGELLNWPTRDASSAILLRNLASSPTTSLDLDPSLENKKPFYPRILSLLPTHRTSVLQPTATATATASPPRAGEHGIGVPRKGVCASDHVAVGAEVAVRI